MIWLNIAIVTVAAVLAFFGTSFLSFAWRRRVKPEPEAKRLEELLPGFDCGLCGKADCRAYAQALDAGRADPALCSPGGAKLEAKIRSILAERKGDPRSRAMRAVVRCSGFKDVAGEDFRYDGRDSCRSAVEFNGGPKRCKEGCVGLGSCIAVCPRGAIRVVAGVAVVNSGLCTGCGLCVKACPTGVMELLPKEQAWFVACSSRREPDSRIADCSAACIGCGECANHSLKGEFHLDRGMARENPEATSAAWGEIAETCPTKAIVRLCPVRKRASSFRKSGR